MCYIYYPLIRKPLVPLQLELKEGWFHIVTRRHVKEGGRTSMKNEWSERFDGSFWPESTLFPWKPFPWKYILGESSLTFPLFLLLVSDWAAQMCARYLLQPNPPTSCQRSSLLSNGSSWFSRYLTCGLLGNGCQASEPLTADWPHLQPPNASCKWAVTFL